jgi:hypothetical protein
VRGEIFAAGNGTNVVKSGEECTPTYFFVALKNDVEVKATNVARFLRCGNADAFGSTK